MSKQEWLDSALAKLEAFTPEEFVAFIERNVSDKAKIESKSDFILHQCLSIEYAQKVNLKTPMNSFTTNDELLLAA